MTDEANAERGEVDITLEGESYVLRPSFAAVIAFERKVGRPLIVLAQEAAGMAMPVGDAAIVTSELVRAWGKAVGNAGAANANVDRIGDMIFDAGLARVLPRLALVLSLAATGGYTPAGEVKATGTTTSGASTVA